MIYLGLRSSPQYLERLARIRVLEEEHTLLSVIGGLAFLHALSPSCRRLVLTDVDADAEEHARLVLAMISASETAAAFLELLTGHRVRSSWPTGEAFGEKIDARAAFARRIPSPELQDLYRRTYAALAFDPGSRSATYADQVVRFFGAHDLAKRTYAWHFGTGCFASEETFAVLRETLARTPPSFISTPLEAIDYRSLRDPLAPRLVVLASNCESPMFTRGDAILRRIQDTAGGPARYVSWSRDLAVGDGNDDDTTDTGAAAGWSLAPGLHCMHWSLDRRLRALVEPPGIGAVRYWSIRHLHARMPYGASTFACTLPGRSARMQRRILRRLHDAVVPLFARIEIATRREPAELARDLAELHYTRSYALQVIEHGGGRCVARLVLRGASRR